MNRVIVRLMFWTFVLLALAGCTAPSVSPTTPTGQPATQPTAVPMMRLSVSYRQFAGLWVDEARTRFREPAFVVGHGLMVGNTWCVASDCRDPFDQNPPIPVEWAIHLMRMQNTGKPIVLIVCNPASVKLKGHPNVWYYDKGNVWVAPDSVAPPGTRPDPENDEGAGSIWDFVEAK